VLFILLDENIDGYKDYLSRLVFSSAWNEISTALGVHIVDFKEVGLAKATSDEQVWEFCQKQRLYLITDNRNQNTPGSLESMVRTRNLPTSLPVFTISDIARFRSECDYVEAVVAKLLEYLLDAVNIQGAARLYMP
jgi:hypothetical protein